jgi:hypothetical protein
MPTEEEISQTPFAKYENGVLRVQGAWAAFGGGKYRAKDSVIRVVVKKEEGKSINLNLRDNGLTYAGSYSGDGLFSIAKSVGEDGKVRWVQLAEGRSPNAYRDFFEFAFRAEGDLLTIVADGVEVVRARDTTHDRAGDVKFGAFQGQGLFKKAEIKILDGAATQADEPPAPTSYGQGWVSLFNGKDLTGWRVVGGKGGWWVKDNELFVDRGPPGAREPGWLMTEREYADFVLRLEFNLRPRADTGVAFRCDPTGTHPLGQAEIQIVDEQDADAARALDEMAFRRTGSLAGLAADRVLPSLERDRWHTMTMELRGRRLKVTIDGTVTVDADLDQHVQEAKKGQGRSGVWRQSGPIALQKMLAPTGVARFRNILVKDLSSASPESVKAGPNPPFGRPELIALRELPSGQNKSGPWLSSDSRALYWADKQGAEHWIWRADRKEPGQPFEGAAQLFTGHDLTLAADMTEVVVVDHDPQAGSGKFALYAAIKAKPSDPGFGPRRKLTEFAGLGFVAAPCLGADGLTLYAEQFGDRSLPPNVRFRRADRTAPWGKPEAVPISGLAKGGLRFPFLSPDGQYLFGNSEESPSGMVVLTSADGGRAFGSPREIEIPGDVIKGKFPRYSPATNELIFSESTTAKTAELYLIRNFDPRRTTKPLK